jgi:cellulose synthase/poly-beta-1,6-N-acetylglucosamine synthase-like glycosyltransferase
MPAVFILFGLFMLYYAGNIIRWTWLFSRLRCHPAGEEVPFVSVVIPARNEAPHIRQCLLSALKQDYPANRFEVILVNDHSTDETREIAMAISLENPGLRVIDLEEDETIAYKKAALTAAIGIAGGEIILQTDGDCSLGPEWVKTMAAQFSPATGMVSGPVELLHDGSGVQLFQAMETMGLSLMGAGAIAANSPNMSNGANLAYRKKVFEEVGGFVGIDKVASGDDELLMQKIFRAGFEIRFAKCRKAVVRTPAQPDWLSLKAQRLRWVSKARHYANRKVNLVQLIFYIAFWGFPVSLFLSIWNPAYLILYAGLVAVKLIADIFLMYRAAAFFHKLHLLRYLIPFRLAYVPYVLWIGIAGNLVKSYSWKGRKIR